MSERARPLTANLVLFASICAVLQCALFAAAYITLPTETAMFAFDMGLAVVAFGLGVIISGIVFRRRVPDWTAMNRHLLAQGYAIVSLIVGIVVDLALSVLLTPGYLSEVSAVLADIEADMAAVGLLASATLGTIAILIILACSYAFARLILFVLVRSRANIQRGHA